MKKVLIFGLTTLLLIACSVGEDDASLAGEDIMMGSNETMTSAFEGIWSIDGTTLPSTYTAALSQQQSLAVVTFPTFPYHAVAERLADGLSDFEIVEPTDMPSFPLTTVGYSDSSKYTEITPSGDSNYRDLNFTVVQADGQRLTLTLGLQTSRSTLAHTTDALVCILAVKRLTTIDSNGQQHRRVFNPEHQLTFTSIKKTH